jgi:membrane associated rhomboid family serine protease
MVLVAVMWVLEVVNSLDGQALDGDGIVPRDPGRLWGVLTAPFLHASWSHLIGNTVPFVVLGVVIALAGVGRLAWVTAIVILVGGLGVWLVAASGTVTIGASGLVFGYAAYLIACGFFARRGGEIALGVVVALVFGGALLSDLVPRAGVSWQGHLFGAIGGVLAAAVLARRGRPA